MESRFGFKDLMTLLMLAAIIVLMILKLVQDDRQWEKVVQLQTSVDALSRDVTTMRRDISSGAVSAPPPEVGNSATANDDATPDDAFRRIREIEKKPDYARGDWYVESFASAVPTLNPLTSQDIYASIVQAKIIEPLATHDYGTLKLTPLLASSWEMAADGLSATFHLRHNVTFSDGQPMTADDVVYTYQLLMNPDITDGRVREYLRIVTSVEKLDDYTVKFHFGQVFYESLMRAAEIGVLPKHLFEKFTPQQIRESNAMVLGTGPYRLRDPMSYTPGDQIELVRNERYWGVAGSWDRIIWRIIEKESADMISFRNGDVDLFGATAEQHEQMLKDADLLKHKNHMEYESVRAGYSYIAWNEARNDKPTLWADKRVRQAMTMCIDRQRLIDEIMLGYATVADGPFHHLGEQHAPDVKPWPYDPQRAVALLKEAGFKRDGDGPMLTPDGRPFEIKLIYPAGSETYDRILRFIADNFARVGILLKPTPQKWQLLMQTLNQRDFDAIMLGWSSGLEVDIEQMFDTRCIKEGDNRNSYSNPKLDALIAEAHVTLDHDKRMEIWHECHRILHEDQPYTFMMRNKARLWYDNRIHNVLSMPRIGVNSVSIWATPIEWYVPAELQKRGKE